MKTLVRGELIITVCSYTSFAKILTIHISAVANIVANIIAIIGKGIM